MSEAFVLDCSATMAWCFEDLETPASEKLLETLIEGKAIVPALWSLEIINTLLVRERRKKMTRAKSEEFLAFLSQLPIEFIATSPKLILNDFLPKAFDSQLSSYDYCYLHLAIDLQLPLATLDESLKQAARKAKVKLLL